MRWLRSIWGGHRMHSLALYQALRQTITSPLCVLRSCVYASTFFFVPCGSLRHNYLSFFLVFSFLLCFLSFLFVIFPLVFFNAPVRALRGCPSDLVLSSRLHTGLVTVFREILTFPVQLTTSRIGNLTRLIHTLLYV